MRFSTLASLLFASAAIAAPALPVDVETAISKRDDSAGSYGGKGGGEESVPTGAAALTESLGTIETELKNTNDSVNAFSGGLKGIGQLLKIQSATTELGDAISNSTEIAKATGNLTLADSTTVGQKFLELEPQIFSLLDNIKAKRPEFDNAGFGLIDVIGLLRQNLQEQQQSAKALGEATVAILDPSLTSTATPVNNDIQTRFSETIAAYQGKGGLIEIPPGLIGLLTGGGGN
ncbi:hypothetical protein SLS56_010581 [Neofusicoccum ribis]|uniref:Antigenic cell wall galactomannoprotein n=1 Tax=Neofusicoccum ribis TaxID=45134 RepID=A0ABR3SE51_9PEZI